MRALPGAHRVDLFDQPASSPPQRDVYSVTRLNQEARGLLERGIGTIWLEGELSNLARPASGHWYFSLKDPSAQVRCAMFKQRNRLQRFSPRDGQQVLLRARVSLYEPRGDYQLIVEQMEEAGVGRLQQLFEQMRDKLAAEGLFDPAHKKPLPDHPRRIGVITSPSGAAIRDVLHVLARRYPAAEVIVYPVPVQGAGAALKIAQMLRIADDRAECDVLLLVRGGGSLEDLWAFNEEAVARALFACNTPVVSGVGHEIDSSIADFAADARAPTPSAAAEMVSPDGPALLAQVARLSQRLHGLLGQQLHSGRQQLDRLGQRLANQHPQRQLNQRAQRIDELEQRLRRAIGHRQQQLGARLQRSHAALLRHSPEQTLARNSARVSLLEQRLHSAIRQRQQQAEQRWQTASRALHAVSPLATLSRGYAILEQADGGIVRDASEVQPGDRLDARLGKGRLALQVTQTQPEFELQSQPQSRPETHSDD
jgi:exodeoxyribonuclease VII large subunit